MKTYILIFRMNLTHPELQPTPEQMETYMHDWMMWISAIEKKGKLAEGGNHLMKEGKVLQGKNTVLDGPYEANNESVAGYIIIYTTDINDALAMAKDCPILAGEGTSVEVREIGVPGIN